jgi:activator of the mannose operon (transcriptional antiterminator)
MKNSNSLVEERRIQIFKRLIDGEHLSYQQLSDEYYVSRSSIAKDIAYLKTLFVKENLLLRFDNSGTYFQGSESQIHRVLKRFILLAMKQGLSLSVLTDVTLFEKINAAFRHSITEKQMEIPESYIQSIVVSILLIVERSNQVNQLDIEEKRQFGKLFLEFDKYPLIYELLKEIEEQEIYHFSSKEVQYLTYLIVGSGLRFFMKNESIPFSFRGRVRNLIQKVSEGIQIDLTQDSRLEEDLTIHLYQLLLRIKAQTTVINPLLDEIKQHYPSLYGIVWYSLNDFLKTYHIGISEDEIGFVSIHFQAAVERMRQLKKIIFVCPNGVGTSSFISAKIRRILPNIDSIETASIDKLKKMDISAIDFIISTIDLPNVARPVVRISPMVTKRDMKRIMNHYIDLVIDNESIEDKYRTFQDIRLLIAPRIYFERFETKEQALNFLISQNDFLSENQRKNFQRSVLEREVLQSTYLDNGFAIPHGSPEFVANTTFSVLILDRPIDWGNQKVDIIVLLMIREDEVQEVESIMKLIMKGIEDKEWFISKMLEVKS